MPSPLRLARRQSLRRFSTGEINIEKNKRIEVKDEERNTPHDNDKTECGRGLCKGSLRQALSDFLKDLIPSARFLRRSNEFDDA